MALIPDELFDAYYTMADEFINNNHIGKSCTLYFPPERVACDNCITVKFASGSSNKYKTGGPIPFSHGLCPYCGGVGYTEEFATQDIRLRVYWTKKDWKKIAGNIDIPDADVMTIGFIDDMVSCLGCQHIQLVSEQAAMAKYHFVLAGEPFPHGFGKDHYFIAYWKRK